MLFTIFIIAFIIWIRISDNNDNHDGDDGSNRNVISNNNYDNDTNNISVRMLMIIMIKKHITNGTSSPH